MSLIVRKHLCSALIAVSMWLGAIYGACAGATEPFPNFLENGSLEIDRDHNGLADDWQASGTALGRIVDDCRQGRGAQWLLLGKRGRFGPQLKRVRPAHQYTLGFWYKVAKGSLAVEISERDRRFKRMGTVFRGVLSDGDWAYKRILYRPSGEKVYSIAISFKANGAQPVEALLDGAVMTEGDITAERLRRSNFTELVFRPSEPGKSATRNDMPLGGIWEFQIDKRETCQFPPLGKWQKANVPHSVKYFQKTNLWYRRQVEVPAQLKGQVVKLRFLGAAHEIKVYCNGALAGTSIDFFNPFEIDITELVRFGQSNEIVIAALQERSETVGPPGRTLAYPFWFHRVSGIYGPVSLVSYPQVHAEDIFVIPSVRRRELVVQMTLRNHSDRVRVVRVANSVADWRPDGKQAEAVLSFVDSRETTLPPQSSREIMVRQTWSRPRLWSPDDPHLYRLDTLLTERGVTLDQVPTRFGFREAWVEGNKLMFNGVRCNVRGFWGGTQLDPVSIRGCKADNANIYRRDVVPSLFPFEADAADREGFFIAAQGGLTFHHSDSKTKPFWKNTRAYFRNWVKAYRNHPSVLMWDTSCEWVQCSGGEDELMKIETIIKDLDPTRVVFHSGSGALRGRSETISLHYPHEYSKGVGGAGSFTSFPNTAYWWEKAETVTSTYNPYSEKLGTKPVLNSEGGTTYKYSGGPDALCFAAGDEAYVPRSIQAINDLDQEYQAILTAGQRYCGVAGIFIPDAFRSGGLFWEDWRDITHPNLVRAYQPICVNVREMDSRFYAGDRVERTLTVYYDCYRKQGDLKLKWLLTDGATVCSKGRESFVLPGGEHRNVTIAFEAPAVNKKTPLMLQISLVENEQIVFKEDHEYTVFPRQARLVRQNGRRIGLLGEDSPTIRLLERLGLRYANLSTAKEAELSSYDLVVIGRDALGSAESMAGKQLLKFVRQGGTVLCFAQNLERYPQWLPLKLALDDKSTSREATIAFPRAPGHPVLEGIAKEDLRYWRGDHVVTRANFRKPFKGNFRALVDSGNLDVDGLNDTSLLEIFEGKGRYVLCQLQVVGKLATEPVAGRLAENLLTYALSPSIPRSRTALIAATKSKFKGFVAELGLVADPLNDCSGLGRFQRVVVGLDQDDPDLHEFLKKNRTPLRKFVHAGGRVFLYLNAPSYHPEIEKLIGRQLPLLAPSTNYRIKCAESDLLQGLSNHDFYWKELGKTLIDELMCPSPPHLSGKGPMTASSNELLAPSGLSTVADGKGQWVLCQMNLVEVSNSTFKPYRILSALFSNMGMELRNATDRDSSDGPRLFSQADLAGLANMGFRDETTGDRQGGWTDQGTNDLRNFPVGTQYFDGIPFKILNPADNKGKSCLVLRGKKRPYFPPEIIGIPINASPRWIYFLHALAWDAPAGTEVAKYRVNYVDGTTREIPVRMGVEAGSWWGLPSKPLKNATLAWHGPNAKYPTVTNVVYLMKWKNPVGLIPAIRSIDVISLETAVVPIVLGITIEKTSAKTKPAKRAAASNLLVNPDFRGNRLAGWWAWTAPAMRNAGYKQSLADGQYVIDIPAVENSRAHSLQLVQNIQLKPNKRYRLSFVLEAENSGTISLMYQNITPPRRTFGLNERLAVSSGKKNYQIDFSLPEKLSGQRNGLWFNLGLLSGKNQLGNFQLRER
jgi:beta-galactosidase